MKLKENFVTHDSMDGQVMVDISGRFSGLVKSNQTAAYIIEQLKEEHTRDEIIQKMLDRYDVTLEVLEKDVDFILKELRSIDALTE